MTLSRRIFRFASMSTHARSYFWLAATAAAGSQAALESSSQLVSADGHHQSPPTLVKRERVLKRSGAAAAQPRRRGLRRRRLRGQLLGARPLRVSSRRRRLGRLLRPLLRAQGGLQRRRAVAERAREVSCVYVSCLIPRSMLRYLSKFAKPTSIIKCVYTLNRGTKGGKAREDFRRGMGHGQP